MPRITQVHFPNTPMQSTICIHSNKQREPCGEIYHRLLKRPLVFTDTINMLNKLDALFDQVKCPQSYHQHRSFGGRCAPLQLELMNGVSNCMDSLPEHKTGEKATFVIQVQFRQNSSWQGTITWAEQKKTLRYRSTLELLKLMDSALEAGGELSSAPDWKERVSGS